MFAVLIHRRLGYGFWAVTWLSLLGLASGLGAVLGRPSIFARRSFIRSLGKFPWPTKPLRYCFSLCFFFRRGSKEVVLGNTRDKGHVCMCVCECGAHEALC